MRYAFGQYILDIKSRELIGKDGPIPLRPKVFGTLEYLIANRDRVVPKQELFDQLWPGVHVGDATLNTCIKAARQAVGDSGRAQAVIHTRHGHGYRFVAEVEEVPEVRRGKSSAALSEVEDVRSERDQAGNAAHSAEDRHQISAGAFQSPQQPGMFVAGKEHKQVTVLHCVLPNASELASRSGAEAFDDLMDQFMSIAQQSIGRYGGTVTQWLGDGFVSLFGAPHAFEDHVRRAVSASLDLQKDLARDGRASEALSARIGLHTGPVVVGQVGGETGQIYTAVGRTTETAQLMQQFAQSGAILASEEVYRVVQSEIAAEPFDADFPKPVYAGNAYLIQDLTTRRSGVPRRVGRHLSRFVGRDQELAILCDRLDQLKDGGGHVVNVSGEPGIGKSRLIDEFQRSADDLDIWFVRANCLAYASASPYLPIRRLLRQLCGAVDTDGLEDIGRKLDTLLEGVGIHSPVAGSLLRQLLELPADAAVVEALSPDERRAQTFDHLFALVAQAAASAPGVIVVEDLHWVDATSESWLSGLAMRLAGMRILLLVSYRPGYQAPWLPQSSATQLALSRLKSNDSVTLVQSIPAPAPLSDDGMNRIVEKAQGNPFFLEELTWSVSAGQEDTPAIPETVQAVLAARIDQLVPLDKQTLQIAAVVGADMPIGLLRAIDGSSEDELQRCLVRLQAAEFLFERRSAPERVFAFKHALTRDVAYMSLVGRDRRAIHRQIADALEAGFGPLVASQPELLARHLTESGETERAFEYWRLAGKRAAERSADIEAVAHFETALRLLERLPERDAFAGQELAILLDLGVTYQNVQGPGGTDVGRVYERAIALGPDVATARQSFEVLWGEWTFRQTRGDFAEAKARAEKLVEIAEQSDDPEVLLQARHAVWTTARFTGVLDLALSQTEAAIAEAPSDVPSSHFYAFGGHDPIVCARGARSIVLWLQGRVGQSDLELSNALTSAAALEHPATTAIALVNAIELSLMRRDPGFLAESIGRLDALATDRGFAMPLAVAGFAEGWRRSQGGDHEGGVEEMERALSAMKGLGRNYQEAYHIALLAEAHAISGRFDQAFDRIDEAFSEIEKNGVSHWAEGEAFRIAGEVHLAGPSNGLEHAENQFIRAIEIARGQGALLIELRATASLSRLWAQTDRQTEARERLSAILDRFVDGGETADLVVARSLLERLEA